MANKDFTPDINFLFEMGNIRLVDRMWRRFHSKDFANVAEHHFRVFWIAMVIAANENKHQTIDSGKIAKICLLHDITESRTGEVDYISRQYVDRKEALAIDDMLDGTSVQQEIKSLWEEYEVRESIESKIVKDADNLDVDMELAEQASSGNPLQKHWKENRAFVARERLFTDTAKAMYDQILKTDPHDWHTQSGRNRRNGGDWKK